LIVLFGSIYGLFVSELVIKIGSNQSFHYVLSGWKKNTLCLIGLSIVSIIACYPIVSAVYSALSNGQE
jgi:predicted Co/Zn/Cd cation transporter (cation efflux family)